MRDGESDLRCPDIALATQPAHAQVVVCHRVVAVENRVRQYARFFVARLGGGEVAHTAVRFAEFDREVESSGRRGRQVRNRGQVGDCAHRVAPAERLGLHDDRDFAFVRGPILTAVQEFECGIIPG